MATAHPSWGSQGPSTAHLPSIPDCGAPVWLGVSPHLGVLIRAWGDGSVLHRGGLQGACVDIAGAPLQDSGSWTWGRPGGARRLNPRQDQERGSLEEVPPGEAGGHSNWALRKE